MKRPNGTAEGPQGHHFLLHTALRWLCHHSRSCTLHANADTHHANLAELETAPNRKRSLRIADALRYELFLATHLPPHIYASIWAHYKAAVDALDPVPPSMP